MVSVGSPVEDLIKDPLSPKWMDYSIEFCGGTHLRTTGDAQAVCLVEEAAVAKGIRRISAVTGEAALSALEAGEKMQARLTAISDTVAGLAASPEAVGDAEAVATAFRVDLDATEMSAGT